MAQLKDTLVQGSLRVTDNIYSDTIYLKSIFAPTTSNGNTLSAGTNGYTLKTNGSSVYWAADNNANYYHTTGSWSGLTYTATANGGVGELKFTVPSGSTSAAGAVQLSSTASSSEQGKAATPKLVYDSITALDSNFSDGTAAKTLTGITITDGKITGHTFTNIAIAASQVTSGTFDTARIPNLAASKITSGTLDFDRLPSLYWANVGITSTTSYKTTPEVATIKINGNTSASAASTSNVTLVYNTTTKALDFNFV